MPAVLSSTVGIVCLATNINERFVGYELTVSGWGDTYYNYNQPSAELRKTRVYGITQERCSYMYQNLFQIVDSLHICAEASNTDACKGDSGGISNN